MLTPLEIRLLRAKYPKLHWSQNPNVSEACAAIARLGGHLKNNGRPGWLVLARGFEKLLTLAEGCRLLYDDDPHPEEARGLGRM